MKTTLRLIEIPALKINTRYTWKLKNNREINYNTFFFCTKREHERELRGSEVVVFCQQERRRGFYSGGMKSKKCNENPTNDHN